MMFLPDWNAAISDGVLVIGGTWMPTSLTGQYRHPPADSFFSDKKLGFRLVLDSGEGQPFLTPYDIACRAGCPLSTLAPATGPNGIAWVATQASSKEVAKAMGEPTERTAVSEAYVRPRRPDGPLLR